MFYSVLSFYFGYHFFLRSTAQLKSRDSTKVPTSHSSNRTTMRGLKIYLYILLLCLIPLHAVAFQSRSERRRFEPSFHRVCRKKGAHVFGTICAFKPSLLDNLLRAAFTSHNLSAVLTNTEKNTAVLLLAFFIVASLITSTFRKCAHSITLPVLSKLLLPSLESVLNTVHFWHF